MDPCITLCMENGPCDEKLLSNAVSYKSIHAFFEALLLCNPITPNTDITIEVLFQITHIESSCRQSIVHEMFHMDHLLFDITPEEEALDLEFTPCQHMRFQSWDDQKCLNYTSFRTHQLLEIYQLFYLASQIDQQGGCIQIPTGHVAYKIHPEELFLFFMM